METTNLISTKYWGLCLVSFSSLGFFLSFSIFGVIVAMDEPLLFLEDREKGTNERTNRGTDSKNLLDNKNVAMKIFSSIPRRWWHQTKTLPLH